MTEGRTTVLVGRSGSGKSTVLAAALDVLPEGLNSDSGDVILDGKSLLDRPEAMRDARGQTMTLVFQEPGAALNPSLSIGRHFKDVFGRGVADWKGRAIELLAEVGIDHPKKRLRHHSHQLSGGERQRVVIALAISRNPRFLLADEPTSALDPVVSEQVLTLLHELRDARGLGLLLVTHDWRVVKRWADEVLVMAGGCLVESGTAGELIERPKHPETQALLSASLVEGVGK